MLHRITKKLSSCVLSACSALCTCCSACILFCVTATFWAYHDKHGTGTITQKSVFLGFSISYTIVALWLLAGFVAALFCVKSLHAKVQLFIRELKPGNLVQNMPNIQNIPNASQLVTQNLQFMESQSIEKLQKLKNVENENLKTSIKNVAANIDTTLNNLTQHVDTKRKGLAASIDTSIQESVNGLWDGFKTTLTLHTTILVVLIVCCIVSFSICWAFVTNWNGDKDKDRSLFAAGVIATLVTMGLCCVAMGFAISKTVKDIKELGLLISKGRNKAMSNVSSLTKQASMAKDEMELTLKNKFLSFMPSSNAARNSQWNL